MERWISQIQDKPVYVAGDFNAKSEMWESPITNLREALVEEWASSLGLCCLNCGGKYTCIRTNEESIVDLTFANSMAANRVLSWRVSDRESKSDHLYIEIRIEDSHVQTKKKSMPCPKRWAIKKLDQDLFIAATLAGSWPSTMIEEERCLDTRARNIQKVLTRACDTAIPRAEFKPRRAMPWWSDGLAQLRSRMASTRRRLTRLRRGARQDYQEIQDRLHDYRQARDTFGKAIRKAKAKAWEEFIESLDENPWGRPYRTVLNKLKRWTPPFTELLDEEVLDNVLTGLFPTSTDNTDDWLEPNLPIEGIGSWRAELEVSHEELDYSIRRMIKKNAAPGPSGIPSKAWALASTVLAGSMRRCFSECLSMGTFPALWKNAKLVLLRKHGKPDDRAAGYRPICLIDDEAKLLERIIAERIMDHLNRGPKLSPCQFGFRKGRSTIDAISRARLFMKESFEENKKVIGISLDIKNAFNSIPWMTIGRALRTHMVPLYLRRIVRSYLENRSLSFPKSDGSMEECRIQRGVPQGSILGPLLWNIGFNSIMAKRELPLDCIVICYADDTLILTSGFNWEEATVRANIATDTVIQRITDTGLEVAPLKTEIAGFYRRGGPADTTVNVAGNDIKVGQKMKYLGLILDGRWTFSQHFADLAPRLERSALALSRLLSNLGGPSTGVRRLYNHVIGSIALYGAPIWAYEINRDRKNIQILHATQRRLTGRMIRAYRTTSFAVNTALSGMPPFELEAVRMEEVYERIKELKRTHPTDTPIQKSEIESIKESSKRKLVRQWKTRMSESNRMGDVILRAIEGQLKEWLHARVGLTFRTTQILTGHGCFGKYLFNIGKESTPRCWHCGSGNDTDKHTLRYCPSWVRERATLVGVIGPDLTWSAIIAALRNKPGRKAFIDFCENVMKLKEVAERTREGIIPPS